jgi:hypothetical protein
MENREMERRARKRKDEGPEEWTVIWCDNLEDVEACISDPGIIWPIIRQTCRRMLAEGRATLPALELRTPDMLGSVWITIDSSEVEITLNKELAYRLEQEEYEECADIRDLILRFQEWPGSVENAADTDEI